MVGPCTTATTFSSSGLQLESHRCSQPSKKIYFRPGLYHLSFLPVLPATAAFTVAESGPRMTEPSVSQQVSRDTTAASSNKPAVSKQRVTITPNIISRREVQSAYCI